MPSSPAPKSLGSAPKLVDVALLREAPWNYKEAGSEDQMESLRASIRRDGSAGVLAIRHLPDGTLEVIDGNHRLRGLKKLGVTRVWCEDFGTITQGQAVLLSHRRNSQWFADDLDRLLPLLKTEVLPLFPDDEVLALELNLTPQELAWLSGLRKSGIESLSSMIAVDQDAHGLTIEVDAVVHGLWAKWCKLAYRLWGIKGNNECFAKLLGLWDRIEQRAGSRHAKANAAN